MLTCTKKTAGCIGYLYPGYHIIVRLNQEGSIINYFSWRRFETKGVFLLWHASGFEHFKLKNLNLQRKEL